MACAHVRRFQMPRTDLDVIPYRAASVDARLSRLLRCALLFLATKMTMAASWLILAMRSCVRVRTNTRKTARATCSAVLRVPWCREREREERETFIRDGLVFLHSRNYDGPRFFASETAWCFFIKLPRATFSARVTDDEGHGSSLILESSVNERRRGSLLNPERLTIVTWVLLSFPYCISTSGKFVYSYSY